MRLFIATRQSVARAIGSALAGKAGDLEKQDNHFRITGVDGQTDVVTWCGGHLLEMAPPESYDPRYRQWRLEDLPIIPRDWKWVEVDAYKQPELARQLAFIRASLKQASMVVHAGDPDREGQWLVDEILASSEYPGPIQRLLLTNLNWRLVRATIRKFEEAPPDNRDFRALSLSAQSRSRADWLYGMNMTRAYTVLGRHAGYQEVLSVGRVQTPLLALVVKRDEDIESFVPRQEYNLEVKFRGGEEYCHAVWVKNKTTPDNSDKESFARREEKLRGKPAILVEKEKQHHVQSPPLLLDLPALQTQCSEIFGYSGVETIKIARRLYEEHHLISYPFTDCRYVPEKFREQAESVLESISANIPPEEKLLNPVIQQADIWRCSAVWDNARLTQHHGIIPVAHRLDEKKLSLQEWRVYRLIICHYVAQFFPDAEVAEEKWVFRVEGDDFEVSRKSLLEPGWKRVIPDSDAETITLPGFPSWSVGDQLHCEYLEIKPYKTRPPLRFTEASLIAAIQHEVNPAHMIETLFRRGYLIKGNKSLYSSGIGRELVRALPAEAVSLELMLASEQELARITKMPAMEAEEAAQNFIEKAEDRIRKFIQQAQQKKNIPLHTPEEVLGLVQEPKRHCPQCHSVMQLKNGRYGSFWGCSAYPACTYTARHR